MGVCVVQPCTDKWGPFDLQITLSMRRHDLTKKNTMTKKKTMTFTFREHPQGSTLVTCDLWAWWGGHFLGHPWAIFFFKVHTILHDIWGFNTIITRYSRYFTSANLVKNCGFFLKARSGDSQQLAKKHVYYNFLGTYPFQCVWSLMGGIFWLFVPLSSKNSFTNRHF